MSVAKDVWGKLWEMAELAELIGWSTKRMRRYLIECGAAQKRGGRWIVTTAKLVAAFPEVWDVMSARRAGEDEAA